MEATWVRCAGECHGERLRRNSLQLCCYFKQFCWSMSSKSQGPLLTNLQQLRNDKDTFMAESAEWDHHLQRLWTLPEGPQCLSTSEQQATLSYTTTAHERSQTKRITQWSTIQKQRSTSNSLPSPRALRWLLPRRRQLQRRRRWPRLRRLSCPQQSRRKDHHQH